MAAKSEVSTIKEVSELRTVLKQTVDYDSLAAEEYKELGGFDEEGKAIRYENGTYKVPFLPIANKHNISRKSMSKSINQAYKSDSRFKPYFTSDNEQIFVQLINLKAMLGIPMGPTDLQTLAKEYRIAKQQKAIKNESNSEKRAQLMNTVIECPSRDWVRRFVKRHETQIVNKPGKMVSKQRVVSGGNRETLDDFYDQLEIALNKTKLDILTNINDIRKIVFNCDETGICLKPKQVSFLMPRGNYQAVAMLDQTSYQYTTVLAAGNAFGELLSPLVIYRNIPNPVEDKYKSWDKPLYRTSKTGWINTQLFNEWFEEIFLPEAKRMKPESYTGPLILLFDGHSTHFSNDLLFMASENNVLIIRFPSHTTHLLQPLDLSFFGPLKSLLSKIIRNRVTSDKATQLGKEQFAEILKEAWNGLDSSCLRRGFALAGIVTPTGIDRQAIKDSQISAGLPYNEQGFQTLEIINEELSELNISDEEDPETSFALRRLKNTVDLVRKPKQLKRKTITPELRDKRGSGYAKILTSPKPKSAQQMATTLLPTVSSLVTSVDSIDVSTNDLSFTQPVASTSSSTAIVISTPLNSPYKDPLVLTPGKTPQRKKVKSKKALFPKSDPNNFNRYCQICLTISSSSKNLWFQCSGECERWHHHLCVREFKHLSFEEAEKRLPQQDWLCPYCLIYGQFKQSK